MINNKNFIYFYIDLDCKPNNWGFPGNNVNIDNFKLYSNIIYSLNNKLMSNINLILIDGRFRVACCLKLFKLINHNCNILFNNFINRDHYHILLNYYEIIEKTDDNNMVLLHKKNVNKPTREIIEKYEIIYD
jgi:hypothetical protein